MPMAIFLNNSLRSLICYAFSDNSIRYLDVFSGSIPASAEEAISDQVLLGSITLTWGSPSNGTMAISGTASATAGTSGTISFARLADGGDTYILQGSAGTGTSNAFIFSAGTVGTGGTLYCIQATLIQPET